MNKALHELADAHYGKSPNGFRCDEPGVPLFGTGGQLGYARQHLFDGPLVVVARKGTLGNPTYSPGPCWVIDTAYAVTAKETADTKWLYYNLSNFDLESLNEATGVPSISRDYLYRIQFETPPRPQQRKIARILTTLDELIEKTEALIAKYQAIKQGLMHDLFTRGVDEHGHLRPTYDDAPELYKKSELGWIPQSWSERTFDGITPKDAPICYGIVQPGAYEERGVPVVAIYNLHSDFTGCHRSSLAIESKYVRSRVRPGDVLLSVKGSTGRVDIVPLGFEGNISRDIARIRPNGEASSLFLRYMLESPKYQQHLERAIVGTTRAELSIGILRRLSLALPSIEEQKNVAAALQSNDARLHKEQMQLDKLRSLKDGLMQDLLTGKVRVKPDEAGGPP